MIDINKLSLEVNNVIYCIKNEGTYYAIIKGFDGYVTGVVSDDGTFDETKRHSEIFSVNGISIHNDKLVLASSEGIHFRDL